MLVKSLVLIFFPVFVFAQEFLDPAYPDHRHPQTRKWLESKSLKPEELLATKSDTHHLISMQTPVRSQMARGTCSIFSATALLEAMLRIDHQFSEALDLSEQFLQYTATRYRSSDGSSSWRNFQKIYSHGLPQEETLPYEPFEWTTLDSSPLARERCGHLEGLWTLKSCLIGNFDPDYLSLSDDELLQKQPDLLKARSEASSLREQYVQPQLGASTYVSFTDEIKSLLRKGVPLTLDIDFYYGAWNHRRSTEKGIPRDLDQYERGWVGYPLRGSVDWIESRKDPVGHSVVIVGYDDSVEVELVHLMPDGSEVQRTYQGVYYFKNSWGTTALGSRFELDGRLYPGYGQIIQDYAHEQGTFYRLPIGE